MAETRTPKQIAADKLAAPPMTDKYAKLREAEHPGAKALARIEAALKPDPTKNVATWSEYQVATLPHNLADVLKYVAAEKARAAAAEADARREAQLATDKARDLLDAEATIATLTAERDALKRERDEAQRDFHEARSVRMETGKLLTKTRSRAENAERDRDEAREAHDGWNPISTCPIREPVDLWCVYGGEEFAQYEGGASIGKLVPNRIKTMEYGFFGNQSDNGVPQRDAPDLVPVAWRKAVPSCPATLIAEALGIPLTLEDARSALSDANAAEREG